MGKRAIPLAKGEQKAYIYKCLLSAVAAGALPHNTKGVMDLRGRGLRKPRRGLIPLRIPLSAAALAGCVVLGVLIGHALACRSMSATGDELRRYFADYLALGAPRAFSLRALGEMLVCYFRAPLIVFLLGFSSVGLVLIPLVCVFQGFLLSFSLLCFALSLGRSGFPLLLALFGIRLAVVLPCTLVLGAAALGKARALLLLSLGGGRAKGVTYGGAYWYRLAVCCVCLLLGALAELWLVPQFLLLAGA